MIDDPDDGSVGGRLGRQERKRGLAAAHEEHVLADAGADRVERDERAPGRLAGRRDRLQDEQREPLRFGSFTLATASPGDRASCTAD